jgi:branched-chain amino acid transport system permease protein
MTTADSVVQIAKKQSSLPKVSTAVVILVVALAALPLLLPARAIGIAIEIQVAALFALAFNFLWQQTRLLSFGHAAFFGMGMFATIHAMRAAASGAILFPLPLMPVAGLVAGFLLGLVVGYFATARSGTYFAMVTLAFAEVIHQLASQWQDLFGGETGLSTMRRPWAGLSFASDAQVYYLALVWLLLAVAAVYYLMRTPLGQLASAIGDNEVRVRFLGHNARLAKTLVFAVSAMFAGLAGGLLAVANENVDYSIFSASASGLPVIHTFIGGAGFFVGPIIGAASLTLLGSVVSDMTRLWPLYQGALFILVVMYLPQGVVGLVAENLAPERRGALLHRAAPLALGIAGLLMLGGAAVFLAEYVSALVADPFALQSQGGTVSARLWGISWRVDSPLTWALPAIIICCGVLTLRLAMRAADRRDGGDDQTELAGS